MGMSVGLSFFLLNGAEFDTVPKSCVAEFGSDIGMEVIERWGNQFMHPWAIGVGGATVQDAGTNRDRRRVGFT